MPTKARAERELKTLIGIMVTAFLKYKDSPKYLGENIFIRHIDGNKQNNNLDNLQWVTIDQTIKNIDNWTVDWVCYLDQKYHQQFIENCRFMVRVFLID